MSNLQDIKIKPTDRLNFNTKEEIFLKHEVLENYFRCEFIWENSQTHFSFYSTKSEWKAREERSLEIPSQIIKVFEYFSAPSNHKRYIHICRPITERPQTKTAKKYFHGRLTAKN